MDEKVARNALLCDGKGCAAPLIPAGAGYVVDGDGSLYCLSCAEAPVIEAIRGAGAVA